MDKHSDCLAVWNEAQEERPRSLIYTSCFTYAEVFKAKCEGKARPLAVEQDQRIENVLQQKFVEPVPVDEQIGILARRMMRLYKACKKPSDAIHLATAVRLNVDELHTYDGSDLLALNGMVDRKDGKSLVICRPHPLPPPISEADASSRTPLLDWLEEQGQVDDEQNG